MSGNVNYTLTTADDTLGVVFARSEGSGHLMIPVSKSEFICIKTKVKENRKTAVPI
jgi:exosome complex RNA-binding protein Csl4